ncbi:hypothetical protein AMAG_03022 [Allomyces macrogynus ATCC 38327]|uniref:Uncharacterized protein n=1 Tax=Allomyces macrogynus (strain ATCC 38327) TaxID=578462 RepID=A0A0L0S412_ALLM3|nr:hypothetical protein AMAG_03022 [Allomyces macrogynus ATCC 38327]|eukprot:KNE57292.1 hypothetical protein AMAG_03022 [Allomyces macrogynus ATCC 38327]
MALRLLHAVENRFNAAADRFCDRDWLHLATCCTIRPRPPRQPATAPCNNMAAADPTLPTLHDDHHPHDARPLPGGDKRRHTTASSHRQRPQQDEQQQRVLRHLRQTASPIRISYSRAKLAVHVVLIAILAAKLLTQMHAAISLSVIPNSSQNEATRHDDDDLRLDPHVLAARAQCTTALTLIYLVGALACALAYLPRLDKAVHVYLVWPLNYFVLEALVLLGPFHTHALVPLAASVIYHLVLRRTLVSMRLWQHSRSFPHLHVAVPRHRDAETPTAERNMPSDSSPSPSPSPSPPSDSDRRPRGRSHDDASPLRDTSTSPPPRATSPTIPCAWPSPPLGTRPRGKHAPATAPSPPPGVHPMRMFMSRARQTAYRTYTLLAPYVVQSLLGAHGAGAVRVSPCVCIASWVLLKLYVSFLCFQVQCLVWKPLAVGREGVVVWRGQHEGLRAGVFC